MNKKAFSLIAVTGLTIGSLIPSFFGDNDIFGLWSILGGFIGGLLGIWLGVKIAKRF